MHTHHKNAATPRTANDSKGTCQLCNKEYAFHDLVPMDLVRDGILKSIRKTHPDLKDSGYICIRDLNEFRTQHVRDMLSEDEREQSSLDEHIIQSLKENEIITRDVNATFDSKLTLSDKLADKIASFGGSWNFIILCLLALSAWIVWNLSRGPVAFDPFPFILLNLVLSCIAALQAPIIMMSQNRQEAKDRIRSMSDYRTNLKAELEIQLASEKLDQLMTHQWRRLMEVQELQMQMIEELTRRQPKA